MNVGARAAHFIYHDPHGRYVDIAIKTPLQGSPLWYRLALQLQEADPERALKYFEKISVMDARNNMVWVVSTNG